MNRCFILSILFMLPCFIQAKAYNIEDITDRFNYCWGGGEIQTHNADGSITYVATTWGGLACWLGGADWTQYQQMVFEFQQPTTVDIQLLALCADGNNLGNYLRSGVTEATLQLDSEHSRSINQVALQTAANTTLFVKRIFLVCKEDSIDDTGNNDTDARLMINELMQSNIDCVMDDLNDFPDSWVELYNGSSTTINLAKYSIGITSEAEKAWPLPASQVKAGEYVMVCCDKEASKLHTNFRLESGKGCEVYLFYDGKVTDHIGPLPKQPAPNISYGRQTDGSDTLGYMLEATPQKANCGTTCDGSHLLGEPLFSQQGFVTTNMNTITLALSMPTDSPEGTEIRYTLDGTEPTAGSTRYTAPLTIGSSKVVRAKLFCKGWLSRPSSTQSYIFFPRQLTLPVISIVTDNRYLNDNKVGIFANNSNENRNNWRRPINIEFFMNGENQPSNINQICETRVAGAASRGASKKSMAIYANKRFGTKHFDYEFFPEQRPGSMNFKSLVLRNAGNDVDYLYMRDAIVQLTMASHADLDWQAWQPAIVYINGQYHCMLNIRERANESNVYSNYDGLEDIDLIENWADLKEGTWDAYNEFKAFYTEKGHTMEEYEQWMDCYEFINLMAMNIYFCNFDFPGNNIIMWRPRNGYPDDNDKPRWRWIAKDCDYTMGLYNQGGSNYNIFEWLYNPNYDKNLNWGANSSDATRLFRRLTDDPTFLRTFTERMAIYMGNFLNEDGTRAIWDEMYNKIKYEYPYHRKTINAWWPNYSTELTNARKWLNQRTEHVYNQLANYYNLGTPSSMIISGNAANGESPAVGIEFNGVKLSKGIFDGKFFAGNDITLTTTPGNSKEVSGWRVQQIGGTSPGINNYGGSTLSMQMPKCTRLIVTPILTEKSAIASMTQESWTFTHYGDQLTLTGVDAGTTIRLYDLRGVLLQQLKATGMPQITLDVKSGQAYVLKVGSKVVKIVK